MKNIKIQFALAISALALITLNLNAQTFSVLHTFADAFPNQDSPDSGLVLLGGTLYGTTEFGPTPGHGSVFSVTTSSNFLALHAFSGPDGATPEAVLTLAGNLLYGTTKFGGTNGLGSVFSIAAGGGGFKELHAFPAGANNDNPTVNAYTNSEGVEPAGGLVLLGSMLYGTTFAAGTGGAGTLFALSTNGSPFQVLHQFASSTGGLTNLDGMEIQAGLLVSGHTLYGTARAGGPQHWGTVFSFNTDTSTFKLLHSFGTNEDDNGNPLDGGLPEGGLVLAGDTLYGTTASGGRLAYGTVYSLQTNGSNFRVLYQFGTMLTNDEPADGINPNGSLVVSGNTLYGTANGGGAPPNPGTGTVFSLDTNGGHFTVLHAFSRLTNNTNSDGAYPPDQVVLSGDFLYGTATAGGAKGGGTVFRVTIPAVQAPPLSVAPLLPGGATLTISWPDTAAGFSLESNSDLSNSAGWQSFQGTILDTNGQETAQIEVAPGTAFFRLNHQ